MSGVKASNSSPWPEGLAGRGACRRRAVLRAGHAWLCAAGSAWLTGCAGAPWAQGPGAGEPVAAGGRWWDMRGRGPAQPLDAAQAQALFRQADVLLLGEQHDQPLHHRGRGALLAWLGQQLGPLEVVAEHLPQGASLRLMPGLQPTALLAALSQAGFEPQGWAWPLHAPLFEGLAQGGHHLLGGNLPRALARQVAREGVQALPPALRTWVASAPLAPPAQAALAQALLDGHCGHLSAARLPGMVAAQRGRDAAMAETVLQAQAALARPAPVVLLAGNGHVRNDFGVPQLLAQARPALRLLSVGLVMGDAPPAPSALPCDLAWVWPQASAALGPDPCAGLAPRMAAPMPTPAPAAQAASAPR